MTQPAAAKPMHLHTIWGRRPMSIMQRLVALLIPWAETKLLNFVKKHELHHRDFWDDGLRLTVPLGNKTPLKALADLATLMEIEGLDKDWEFVAYVLTDTPDEFDPVTCIRDWSIWFDVRSEKRTADSSHHAPRTHEVSEAVSEFI